MRNTKSIWLVLGLIASAMISCSDQPGNSRLIEPGVWRGEFKIDAHQVPFNFRVSDDLTGLHVSLINGAENAEMDSVETLVDSIAIQFRIFDAVLVGKVQGDSLKGFYRRNQTTSQGIPFVAYRNQGYRFVVRDSAKYKAAGTWSAFFKDESNPSAPARNAVGVFEQEGSKVTGTFLTTTGDYRYWEGVVDGSDLKLSVFGGSNPSLIKASFADAEHISGTFVSSSGVTKLELVKNDTARLPDPYALTYLKSEKERFSFSFPDENGKQVSLADEKYSGKVVIVTLSGSWCPNCMDEASFLSPWYNDNKDRGVEVVTVSFERKDDPAYAWERIGVFKKRFGITYDVLLGGKADKKIVAEKFPQLNTFLSFPTTLFIDKLGRVRKIHTGYTGPATGKYHEQFVQDFNDEVDALLKDRPTDLGLSR